MKNTKLFHFALFLLSISVASCSSYAQKPAPEGYHFKFKVNGVKDTVAYLTNYFGEKLYYKDTAQVDKNGFFEFKDTNNLKGGKYAVVLPGPKYFEIVVSEYAIDMETDTADFIAKMKVNKSKENKVYYDYVNYLNEMKAKATPIREEIQAIEEGDKKREGLIEQLKDIDKTVKDRQKEIVELQSDLLIAKIIKMSFDVVIPDAPKKDDGSIDSTFGYFYFKNHYFDNIDLKDERLVNDPIFHTKLKYYFEKMILQIPDSINKATDELLAQIPEKSDMYKYVANWVINTYNKSKIMGMDAVFVHLARNYYLNGKAFWATDEDKEKIKEAADKIEPILLGKKAPYLSLADTNGKFHNLYDIKAPYIVLYFWDSGCGHCKKETPKLKDLYNEKLKKEGIVIYSVGTELENEDWQKYIKENNLPFLNVSDSPDMNSNPEKYLDRTTVESLNFRFKYDIFSTPKVFLLDKDKKIIAKGLGVEQLGEVIEQELERAKRVK